MLVEYKFLKGYLLGALEGSPAVLARLLDGITDEEADRRPDPERFTIREAVAHLADWEPVFQERLRRTKAENEPTLAVIDEGRLAIDHDYAHSNLAEQLALFAERRRETCAFVADFSPEDWQRTASRPNVGIVTMESLVTLIPLHDAYHLRQVAQWRN